MVDPVSVTIGVASTLVTAAAALGLYLAGRAPDHIVNMREVSSYYRRQSALEALSEDVDDDGAE
jgi:hypothetical protein